MGSSLDRLIAEQNKRKGVVDTQPSSIIDQMITGKPLPTLQITRPEGEVASPVYDEIEPERKPLTQYLGQLAELGVESFKSFLDLTSGQMFIDPEKRKRANENIDVFTEAYWRTGERVENFARTSIAALLGREESNLAQPTPENINKHPYAALGDNILDLGSGFIKGALESTGGMVSAIASNPTNVLGDLAVGLLDMTVRPLLTLTSGKTIVEDEILDATTEEVSSAMLAGGALPVSAGVYTGLAGAGRVAAATGIGAAQTKGIGILARNIAREYGAQAVSGLVQEGLSNPEDISAEMIARNLANPLALALAVPVGGARYLKTNRETVKAWMDESRIQNADVMTSVPSANQMVLNQMSDIGEAMQLLDALTTSDDWISAGIKKIKKNKESVYQLMRIGKDKADEIISRYTDEGKNEFVKPVMEVGEGVVLGNKTGHTIYFANSFDQYVATSQKPVKELAKEFKLPVPEMEAIIQNIAKAIDDAEVESRAGFNFKQIPDVKLPDTPDKLKVYRSVNDDILMTYRKLTEDEISDFTSTGFIRGETASWNGKNVEIIGTFDGENKPIAESTRYRKKTAEGDTVVDRDGEMMLDHLRAEFGRGSKAAELSTVEIMKLLQEHPEEFLDYQKRLKRLLDRESEIFRMDKALHGYDSYTHQSYQIGKAVNAEVLARNYISRLYPLGELSGTRVKIRPTGGKPRWVNAEELSKISGGDKTIWNKLAYEQSLVEDFLRYADRDKNKTPFMDLIARYVSKKVKSEKNPNGWNPSGANEKFAQIVYQYIQENATAKNAEFISNIERGLEKEALALSEIAETKLNLSGFRAIQEGAEFAIYDIQGRKVGTFETLNDLTDFALANFQDINVPDLTAASKAPMFNLESVMPATRGVSETDFNRITVRSLREAVTNWAKRTDIGQFLRRADRRILDLGDRAGVGDVAAKLTSKVDDLANGIDAMEQGPARGILKKAEEANKLGKKIGLKRREEVTQVRQQISQEEARAVLSPEEIANAEVFAEVARKAGGLEKVRTTMYKIRTGQMKFKQIKEAPLAEAVKVLDQLIKEGTVGDYRLLRYVDLMDRNSNLTRDQLAARFNWDKDTYEYAKLHDEIYKEAIGLFNITDDIIAYAPHIAKWEGLLGQYDIKLSYKKAAHDLDRLGLMPNELKVTDSSELLHRYLKVMIHEQAPTATGKSAGELLQEIEKDIRILAEAGVETSEISQWVDRFRGLPEIEQRDATKYVEQIEKTLGKKIQVNMLGTLMDLQALLKISFRPFLLARDIIGTYQLAIPFGIDVANATLDYSSSKLRKIETLQKLGELPQTNSDVLLSREGRSALSKLTDKGMQVSGQHLSYKSALGNIYLAVQDKSFKAIANSGGDIAKLRDELGWTLSSHPEAHQRLYLSTAITDPITASRILAKTTAYAVANRFGRLHNPMSWQGTYGRAFGQLGSWRLNAITTILESVNNSNSKMEAAAKLAAFSAFGATVTAAATYAGINAASWVLNPVAMVPGAPGPVVGYGSDVSRAMQMIASGDEDTQNRGYALLQRSTSGFFDPIAIRDGMKGIKIMQEEGDFFKAGATALGVKFEDDK